MTSISIKESVINCARNPKKAASVISHKLLANFGHNKFRKFIVLTRSRTGSNLLLSLLNSHPNIYAEEEIFSKLGGRNHKDVLEKAFAKQPYFVKAKGFKIFYLHPFDDKSNDIWNALESLDELHVIHLKRRNILRTLISRKIAGIEDVWLVKSSDQNLSADKNKITVSFTVDELNKDFRQTRGWEQAGDNRFCNHPIIEVYYEDLVDHRESTYRRVTDFLGVRLIKPETDLRKQNLRSMREIVTNYDELKSAFLGTEWEPFFED
jgi:LPS sulfotransferase NodH